MVQDHNIRFKCSVQKNFYLFVLLMVQAISLDFNVLSPKLLVLVLLKNFTEGGPSHSD